MAHAAPSSSANVQAIKQGIDALAPRTLVPRASRWVELERETREAAFAALAALR
jgi:hypothetical protein